MVVVVVVGGTDCDEGLVLGVPGTTEAGEGGTMRGV